MPSTGASGEEPPQQRVAALFARHDQFARLEHQAEEYGDARIQVLETGHIGAALDGQALRRHVLQSLDELQASAPKSLHVVSCSPSWVGGPEILARPVEDL